MAVCTIYAVDKRPHRVQFGMYADNVAGHTVHDLRLAVGELWGIPVRAVAYCGTTVLDEDDFLPVGAIIEFHTPR